MAVPVLCLLGGAAGIGYFSEDFFGMASAGARMPCNIKGNIAMGTGERIYHVPGQRHYSDTSISAEYGERWFCSEAEARQAGWRRAKL